MESARYPAARVTPRITLLYQALLDLSDYHHVTVKSSDYMVGLVFIREGTKTRQQRVL